MLESSQSLIQRVYVKNCCNCIRREKADTCILWVSSPTLDIWVYVIAWTRQELWIIVESDMKKMNLKWKIIWKVFFFNNFLFSVRLLSVLRGHSFFSSPPQRPMTSDFKGFLSQILSITLFSYLNSWERAIIPFSMLSAKQGNHWYHFYNVFGMTWSLTGDWNRDLPPPKPALHH